MHSHQKQLPFIAVFGISTLLMGGAIVINGCSDDDGGVETETVCGDNMDDDGDGYTDCDDSDCEDSPLCQGGGTIIEGQVYYYYPEGVSYYYGYVANAQVTTVGLSPEITDTTDDSGVFVLENVPVGETIYLRAEGQASHTDAVSHRFTVTPNMLVYLIQADEALVGQIEWAWSVDFDPTNGILVGLTCRWDPSQDPPITTFIGDATVSVDPAITEPGFDIVYLNPADLQDTTLTATHPSSSLFFGLNLPVTGQGQFYTLTAQHQTESFTPVEFPVEANTISYVLIHP